MFNRICDHACVPGVRAAGDNRHPGDLILDFGSVATAADVEVAKPEAGVLFRLGAGWSFSLEIFVGFVVLCVSSRGREHETVAAAGTAD